MRGIVPGASFFFATSPSRVRERIAAHGLCDIDTGASCNHDYTRPTPSGADRFPTVRAGADTRRRDQPRRGSSRPSPAGSSRPSPAGSSRTSRTACSRSSATKGLGSSGSLDGGAAERVLRAVARHQQHPQRRVPAAQLGGERRAVHARHDHVGHEQVGGPGHGRRERLDRVGVGDHPVAGAGEHGDDQRAQLRRVLDDEHQLAAAVQRAPADGPARSRVRRRRPAGRGRPWCRRRAATAPGTVPPALAATP